MLGSLACYKEPLGSSSLMQSPKAVWLVTFLFATNAELNILARWRMCHTKREARENSSPRATLRPLSHKKSESKTSSSHQCEASGCTRDGNNSIIGLYGTTEYYCDEHFEEMQEAYEKITD